MEKAETNFRLHQWWQKISRVYATALAVLIENLMDA
jgi:hypothetical protein